METQNTGDNTQSSQTSNPTWQKNNELVNNAYLKLIRKYERIPSKTAIATEAGLSRTTVHKHIKQTRTQKHLAETMEQFALAETLVLGKLLDKALEGDIPATRLYAQINGNLPKQK